jgi:S1-C subfamily serine protease
MKKVALYSRSSRSRRLDVPASAVVRQHEGAADAGPAGQGTPLPEPGRPKHAMRIRKFVSRHERLFLVVSTALLSVLLLLAYNASKPPPHQLTQRDIDAAVIHTLERNTLPAPETKAFKIIQRSIVRVRQLEHLQDKDADRVSGVGTGVVIVDKGIILTNLHVVAGAQRVQVVFSDGLVSEAAVIGQQPENDLAVLQAATIPDDLVPATLRSTRDLEIGSKVIAVGYPFGIGPSVSSGVVSGLKREYHSPEGKRLLTNLIQFDAAVNPGNSGGPLVTMDGEVVGIVTALLNPTEHDVFIGIGFAVPIENAATAAGISPF